MNTLNRTSERGNLASNGTNGEDHSAFKAVVEQIESIGGGPT